MHGAVYMMMMMMIIIIIIIIIITLMSMMMMMTTKMTMIAMENVMYVTMRKDADGDEGGS